MATPKDAAAAASAPAGSSMTCRMYENKYPEVDEVVMVRVKSIAEMGAYVSLLEYGNIEGMILLSELSRRRIRSITKLIRVGRQEPVVVLRVDKEKGYIDLSKRRVTPDDLTRIEEKYNNSKTVHSIMLHVAKTMHQDVEKLYQQFGWPMYRKYGHAIEGFKRALTDPDSVFADTEFSPELRDAFVKNIRRRLAPQPVKMRADVEVTCFGYEGIDAIRAALAAGQACGTDDIPVKIQLVAPPLYVVLCQSLDKTKGLELLQKAIDEIVVVVRAKQGECVVRVAPRAISEREDRELLDKMEELERQNAEVGGDSDEEGKSGDEDSDSDADD